MVIAISPERLVRLLAVTAATLWSAASSYAGTPEPAYQQNCAACHGEHLKGAYGPPLVGANIQAKLSGKRVDDVAKFISQSMPPSNPGSLSAESYLRLARLILDANGLSNPQSSQTSADTNEAGGISANVEENKDAVYQAVIAQHQRVLSRLTVVDAEMLHHTPAADWLSWRRTEDGAGFSPLDQINRESVRTLGLAWTLSLPTGTNGITPLAHDGVLFLNSNGTVLALDASSGDTLWTFSRTATVATLGPPITQPRGMAILGKRLFVPTLDNHMLALDIQTGAMLWDHSIGGLQSTLRVTGPPIVAHGKVIQGMSGCAGVGEPGGCFIVALDVISGNEIWRFNTIAKPGTPDGDTWNGAPSEKRYGSSVWSGGTYDAETGLVYFGTGQTYHIATLMLPNAKPRRENAGLYTDSTLALNPDTGALVWYFQHMARDVWDMDWAFERIITSISVRGRDRKVVVTMGKLGILDILDASTGKYISSADLGLQTLVTAIDPKTGRKTTDPALEPDAKMTKEICPFATGFRNWPSTSFDPDSHRLYVPVSLSCMDLGWSLGEGFDLAYTVKPYPNSDGYFGRVAAVDLSSGKTQWLQSHRAPEASSVLGTAGKLIFEGGRDRMFRASDSEVGTVLWSVRLDNTPNASPITFAKDGIQYVAITTGGGSPNDVTMQSLTPELDHTKHTSSLFVFRLQDVQEKSLPRAPH